jgi:hypothetical protein
MIECAFLGSFGTRLSFPLPVRQPLETVKCTGFVRILLPISRGFIVLIEDGFVFNYFWYMLFALFLVIYTTHFPF